MALSFKQIENAKYVKGGRTKLWDERGLFLLLTPKSKLWRQKYRINGKEKLLSHGSFKDVSLADARDRRDDARKLIARGIDPIEAKRERKRQRAKSKANSFEVVARAWHKMRCDSTLSNGKKEFDADHLAMVLRSLERDVFPYIGARPIAEIETAEIIDVLKRVETRGALDVASRIKQRCSAVFRRAIAAQIAKYNPVDQIERDALQTRKVQHRAHIKRDDLPAFLHKLETYDGDPLTSLALRLVLLTFLRSGELRGARWTEFNFDSAEWRIPAERMKMDSEHVVPLSRQAISVLREIRKFCWSDELLFPSQGPKGDVMSENTLLYAMYRLGYHGRATVHGLRGTASTILNEELGFAPDVIERQLSHVDTNKVRRAYNHAQYLPERKKMMQVWADYLDQIAAGDKKKPPKIVMRAKNRAIHAVESHSASMMLASEQG